MTTLLIALAVVAALVIYWMLRSGAGRSAEAAAADDIDTLTGWPPQATRVLTTAERQAYEVLRNALPAHMILAQVPLQRFIKVPTRNSYAEWLRRVGQLSADFVVCDRYSQVIAVVEIDVDDDTSGGRAQRRRQRMIRVLKSAQIPIHVWPASTLPSAQAAREALDAGPADEAAAPSGAASLPGRFASPAAQPAATAAASPTEDGASPGEMREPPPSTWFDDFDSAPAPLSPASPKEPNDTKSRPGR
ncbi:MAG TPA: DUF2726 domain-containing protein [Albitalea sp.]|nr:DUF2726 domain-containing protein [Albitalea sp.]